MSASAPRHTASPANHKRRERQHVRREHAERERFSTRDRVEEPGHDERRCLEDQHVADSGQDQRRSAIMGRRLIWRA
jgi:hypothetical protein